MHSADVSLGIRMGSLVRSGLAWSSVPWLKSNESTDVFDFESKFDSGRLGLEHEVKYSRCFSCMHLLDNLLIVLFFYNPQFMVHYKVKPFYFVFIESGVHFLKQQKKS